MVKSKFPSLCSHGVSELMWVENFETGMIWDAVCMFQVFPICQNGSPYNNALLGGGGVNSLNEYDSTIQLHMLTQNGEYESVDAVLFSSSSLVFEFHLIYVNLSQKWTINKTTTIDLRGI